MATSTYGRPYFPALDGLRGIAILMVVFSHNLGSLNFYTGLGDRGVDLFFVLSGFLITDILLKTKGSKDYFKSFFIKRTLRILPLYYATLLLFFILAPLSSSLSASLGYYGHHWPWVVFHLNNILPVFFVKPAGPLMLNHFWSLSLEEQFYLCWPFLVLVIPSNRRLIALTMSVIGLAIIARLISWIALREGYIYWYVTTNIRFDCLGIGCLVAAMRYVYPLRYQRYFILTSLSLLLLSLGGYIYKIIFDASFPYFVVFGLAAFSSICGLLVIYCISPVCRKLILENPVLIFFGKISYGLYVFHWPFWILGTIYLPRFFTHSHFFVENAGVITGLITAAIAVGISTISYFYFEKTMMGLNRKHKGITVDRQTASVNVPA
jgi:peptidoglycan/LPS O-acetylase OafA/YrhL